MVATLAPGRPDGRYRRRRRWPALVLIVALGAVVALVWSRVLTTETEGQSALSCPPPPAAVANADGSPGPTPGTVVQPSVLDEAVPAVPAEVPVRVLNASGERGQAAQVAAELAALTFTPAPDQQFGDDSLYTDQNMACFGQIRFGTAGLSQARTASLVFPCAELVQDARTDTVVDVALGTAFSSATPSPEVQTILATLAEGDPAAVDPDLLAGATSVSC